MLAHDAAILASGAEDPFRWEVAVEVPQPKAYCDPVDETCLSPIPTIRLEVYDDAGVEVTGSPFEIEPSIASPDWTADFNGDDPGATWREEWGGLALDTEFLTFEFSRVEGTTTTLLGRYVYVPTALDADPDGFYRPTATTGPAAVRFEVYVEDPAPLAVGVRAGPGPDVGPLAERLGPSYEDDPAFAGSYVLPYNHDAYATTCGASCSAEPPAYFLARLLEDEPPPTLATQAYAFADDDVVIAEESDGVTWAVDGLELAFRAGRRLVVKGAGFAADGVTFTEAREEQGWGGLRFVAGSGGELTDVTVELVAGAANVAGDAAVEVVGATVALNGALIQDGTNVHGVWASDAGGTHGRVTLDQGSVVREMLGTGTLGGVGVVAANGGVARVYGSDTRIEENGSAGVAATGSGSEVYLYQSDVLTNAGHGVASEQEGVVRFRQEGVPTTVAGVEVRDSRLGGLFARTGGDIRAGLHDGTTCNSGCQNLFPDNYQNVPSGFDAKAQDAGSTVYAKFNDWDGEWRDADDETDLVLVEALGPPDEVQVEPLWDPAALRPGGSGGAAMASALAGGPLAGSLGADSTVVGDSSAVGALVDAAYAAMETDDAAGAGAALLAALPLAVAPDEVGLAFATTARHLAHAADPALEGYLATRTALTDPARPWALVALLAADAAQGQTEAAWAGAGTLASEYAGTEHALAGLAMTARLAFAAGDLASAAGALAELQTGWPDLLATEAAGALVRWMHEEGADSLGAGAGGRLGASADGAAEAVAEAAVEAPSAFRLLAARPNPFAQRTVVPFEVAAPSWVRVAVYDVLGREVAVLADGAYQPGRYERAFDGRGLASGLYLVRARVEPEAETGRSYAQRITLVR